MVGDKASYEFRWRRWALLRDVITTKLERDRAAPRFPRFTSIGQALGVDSLRIEAAPLEKELHEIKAVLREVPVEELVLGPITARVLYPTLEIAAPRALTSVELAQVAPIGAAKMLDEYFASMLDSMLDVCAHPSADGTIEVLDG